MSRIEITAVAVRLLSLAMFAMAAVTGFRAAVQYFVERIRTTVTDQFVETSWRVYSSLGLDALGLGALAGGGVWLLAATYYWQRAEKLAERMVDDDPEPVTRADFTSHDLFVVACRLIGIVVLVRALRTGVWLVSEFAFYPSERYEDYFDGAHGRTALQVALEAGLAIWLLFGTRGIIGIVAWARSAGTPEPPSIDDGSAPRGAAPVAPAAAATTTDARSTGGEPVGEASTAALEHEEPNR